MPYGFKDADEKSKFLCICLKSSTENGGKVDQDKVAKLLGYPKRKVSVCLGLVKKDADAIDNNEGIGAAPEESDDAVIAETVGVPKKRKFQSNGKGKKEQPPKKKMVKVEENADDSGDSGDA